MKNIYLLFLIGFLTFGCASNRPKSSFTLSLFANLENKKCIKYEIDGYLLRTGYFESIGSKNGARTFSLFSGHKDIVVINTYPNKNYYYLATSNPDIYNLIKKNGIFLDTAIDENDNGRTFLKYQFNNNIFYIGIKESQYGKTYTIQSLCNR